MQVMRSFLKVLRKKFMTVARQLHAFALRFAKRRQELEVRRTPLKKTIVTPVQPSSDIDVGFAGKQPMVPAQSAAAADASAQQPLIEDVTFYPGDEIGVVQEIERVTGVTAVAETIVSADIKFPTEPVVPFSADRPSDNALGVGESTQIVMVSETHIDETLNHPTERHPAATTDLSPLRHEVATLGPSATHFPEKIEDAKIITENIERELIELCAGNLRVSPTPPVLKNATELVSPGATLTPGAETEPPPEPNLAPPSEFNECEQREGTESQRTTGEEQSVDEGNAPLSHLQDRSRLFRATPESCEKPLVHVGLCSPSEEYVLWNKAVVQHCLLADTTSEKEDIYLSVTPRILSASLAEAGGAILAPDEAEASFIEAVSKMYNSRVLQNSGKLQVLRRCGSDGLPECVAFLALSVLAAYRMHTDEEMVANAYYRRFDELLRCGLSGGLPRGFDLGEFEGLWLFLRSWLDREHSRHLAMPKPDVGLRRYVALPLTHVPLRQVDIERLPDFFDWARYEAGQRLPLGRIDADLYKWARQRGVFTAAGTDALANERRRAVLAQIALELESWDGSRTDPQGRRSAPVEIFLQWERRIPMLSYLPRRPTGFPATFDDGVHVLDAGQDGWYEPFQIGVEEGPELINGFSWEAASDGNRIVLRRAGASSIALAPSEFAGPISHNGLLLGALGAALCLDSLAKAVQSYFESVTGRTCVPVQSPNIPGGWVLFTGINPVRRLAPPDGLETLEIVTNPEIIPQGGLRLGKRWAWLSEAPPKFLVAGFDSGEIVAIDGEQVELGDGGLISDKGLLTKPGVHIVEVGRARRRVEIVDPEIVVADLPGVTTADVSERYVTALPGGSWTLIGSRPGESTYVVRRSQGRATLGYCPFPPIWSVSFGYGHGAVVLCLVEQPPPPKRLPRMPAKRILHSMRSWAEAIYNANIRRPALCSPWGSAIRPETRATWAEYVETAKEIKRKLKSERR